MKRLVSVVLALSLLGSSAAVAAPYDHGNRHHDYSHNNRHHDRHYRGHHNNGAAVVGVLGILALGAILASQNHHDDDRYDYESDRDGYDNDRDGYDDRYDGNDPDRDPQYDSRDR